jgi:GH15 family glucan-1,4-alpha-glucosidase
LVDATAAALGEGPYLRRYSANVDDGFDGREGAFVPMSWWLVSAMATVGQTEEAQRRADALCEALPELLAEEVDAATGELRGNHPLVWSHMEAARALHLIAEADVRDRWREPGVAAARLGRLVAHRWRGRSDRLAEGTSG